MSHESRTDALVESFHYAEEFHERYEAMRKLAKDLEQDIRNGMVFLNAVTKERDLLKRGEEGSDKQRIACNRYIRFLTKERDQLKLDCITLAEELAELKDDNQADALAEIHEAEHPRKL